MYLNYTIGTLTEEARLLHPVEQKETNIRQVYGASYTKIMKQQASLYQRQSSSDCPHKHTPYIHRDRQIPSLSMHIQPNSIQLHAQAKKKKKKKVQSTTTRLI